MPLLLVLLGSTAVDGDAVPQGSAAVAFLWMVDGGVLLSEDADAAWGVGPSTLRDDAEPVRVSRKADPERLPAELRQWLGQKIRVVREDGSWCDATVNGFRLLGRVVPHFTTRQSWKELDRVERIEQAWKLAGAVLVGETDRRCDGVWARSAALPPPTTRLFVNAEPELAAAAIREIRRTKAYRQTQQAYEEATVASDAPGAVPKSWEEHGEVKLAIKTVRYAQDGEPVLLLSITLAVLGERGRDFSGGVWALWEVKRRAAGLELVPRNTPGELLLVPTALVDTDADGCLNILFTEAGPFDLGVERGIVRQRNGLYDEAETLAVRYFDSPF